MLPAGLFDHPVGAMPPRARWYLAINGILLTVLIALHFAVQADVQSSTELALRQWGEKSGIRVQHVRYRLLRNALTLKQVRIRHQGVDATLDHVLLNLVPSALRQGRLEVLAARVDGLHGVWHFDVHALSSLLSGLPAMTVHRLELHGRLGIARPGHEAIVEVSGISLRMNQGQWHFVGRVGGGHLEATGRQGSGVLGLDEIPAAPCFRLIGLEGVSGGLSGQLAWSGRGGDGWSLSGAGKWEAADGREGQISMDMRMAASGKEMRLKLRHWPVHGLHERLAAVGVVHVRKAWLDTTLEYREGHDAWHLQGGQGSLRDVSGFLLGDAEPRSFRFETLSWTSLELDDQHRLAFAGLEIVGGEISLPVAGAAGTSEESAALRVNASQVGIRDIMLHWRQDQRVLSLPLLGGRLDLEPGRIGFDLASRNDVEPQWHVRGSWALDSARHVRVLQSVIDGKRLPLQEMMPVLNAGMPGLKALPLSLSGTLGIHWLLSWDGEHLAVNGAVELADFKARHGSARWRADRVRARFRIDGHQRHVEAMTVHGWHYLAPLAPLSVAMPHSRAPADHPWLELLRAGGWSVDSLRLENGSVSVGEDEDVWARGLLLVFRDLGPGRAARMELTGSLGEGELAASFQVQPYREPLRWQGALHVRSALPFFLQRWLAASGMPVLIRGRWWLDMRVVPSEKNGYSFSGRFRLRRPLWMAWTPGEHDPMLVRTGLSSDELLRWLDLVSRKGGFRWENKGAWEKSPLSWWGMLSAALDRVRETGLRQVPAGGERMVQDALLRLHDQASLSHNERLRMFKVIRRVRANKGWCLDLRPEVASRSLDASTMQRIRNTQRLVEDYAAKHGLERSRVFPLWPVGTENGPEVGAIRVQAIAPRSGS